MFRSSKKWPIFLKTRNAPKTSKKTRQSQVDALKEGSHLSEKPSKTRLTEREFGAHGIAMLTSRPGE